jgi:ribosome-associated protein
MPRKPSVHQLQGTEATGRVVRSDHRAAMEDLKDLANRLAELPAGQRRELPLDEEVLEALERLVAAGQRPERRRILMRVKLLLAESELGPVRAFIAGETPAALAAQAAEGWRTRLLAGGDEVLQYFVEAHPAADRQALRAAVREAKGDTPAAKRAFQRVFRIVCDAVLASGAARGAAAADEPEVDPDDG